MTNVFLGGTCNESTWRERLIEKLLPQITYFHPVVDDWNEEAQQNEIRERENCDVCLYVLTPKMTGYYSIAEVVDDSNKRPDKTVLCIINEDYDWKQKEIIERKKELAKSYPDDIAFETDDDWEWGHPFTWCGDRPHSFTAIENLVRNNGARVFNSLDDVAMLLNTNFG